MKSTHWKTKLSAWSAAMILLTSFALTGCKSVSTEKEASRRTLYQPPILNLAAGVPVQTADGIYTPQVDEIWHSPQRYEERAAEARNLAAALQQLKAETK